VLDIHIESEIESRLLVDASSMFFDECKRSTRVVRCVATRGFSVFF